MLNKKAELYKAWLKKKLDTNKNLLTSSDIEALQSICKAELEQIELDYDRYYGERLPIHERENESALKECVQMSMPYRKEIADQASDFVFANGLTILYREDKDIEEYINDFIKYSDLGTVVLEAGRESSGCGVSYFMMFIDEDKKDDVVTLHPGSVVTLNDRAGIAKYAFYFYEELDDDQNIITVCEFYDKDSIQTWRSNPKSEEFSSITEEVEMYKKDPVDKEHGYEVMPIIAVYENKKREPAYRLVETQIDTLDVVLSAHVEEILEYKNAYIVFTGGGILSEEDALKIMKLGGLNLPDGVTADYLIKELNVDAIKHMKETLQDSIYIHSKTLDTAKFSDSTESGESRRYKLINLENRATDKENAMIIALKQLFRVYSTSPNVLKDTDGIDAYQVLFQFSRNLPSDERYAGEVANLYKDILSEETILSKYSSVQDVKREIELKRAERKLQESSNSDASNQQQVNENKDGVIVKNNPKDMFIDPMKKSEEL